MSRRRTKAGALQSDSRWTDKESKSLQQLTFPDTFKQQVDLRKVNLAVIKPWVNARITELLTIEDDIVADFATSLLEDPANPSPDPRKLQVALMGFLDQHAATFVEELWRLLLSAQQSIGGIPQEFVERKKKELEAQRAAERAARPTRGHDSSGPSRRGDPPAHHSRSAGSSGANRERAGPSRYRDERDDREPYQARGKNADRRHYDDQSYGQRRYEGRREPDRYHGHADRDRDYGRGRTRDRSRSFSRSPSPPPRRYARRSRSRSRSPSLDRDHDDAVAARRRPSRRYSASRSPSPVRRYSRREEHRYVSDRDDDDERSQKRDRHHQRTEAPRSARAAPRSPSRTPPYDRRARSPSHSRSRSRTPTYSQPTRTARESDPVDREEQLREQLLSRSRAT